MVCVCGVVMITTSPTDRDTAAVYCMMLKLVGWPSARSQALHFPVYSETI